MFDEMPKKETRVVGLREKEKVRKWRQGGGEETGTGFESGFFGAFLLEKGEP